MTSGRLAGITAIAVTASLAATYALAFTVTDTDGDGYFEVNEVLTFEGDAGTIIPYDNWRWDFDNNGIFDASGRTVDRQFQQEGGHLVVLQECNQETGICETQGKTITIVRAGTTYDCAGFLPPFHVPLNLRLTNKRTIPVKMLLTDEHGDAVTHQDLSAPPVISVQFKGAVFDSDPPSDVDLEPVGRANEDNVFRYDEDEGLWIYNLGTRQLTASGIYTVTVKPGSTSYNVDTSEGCTQTFQRLK